MSNINTNPGEIGQKKPILAVVIAALIVIVLLAPCILAAVSDTIYPRTTVAGIDVGGMEYAQAQDVLARELPSAYENAVLSIAVDRAAMGEEAVLVEMPLSDIRIEADPSIAARAAFESGRSGNFFTSGIAYAQSLLFGRNVAPDATMDASALSERIRSLADQVDVPVTECTWRIVGEELLITKPKSGFVLDQDAVLDAVENAVSQYNFDHLQFALQETSPAPVTMEELHADAYSEASNAYYDKETGTIMNGNTGVDFDPIAVQKLIDAAQSGEEISVPVTIIKPEITKEEMEANLFRDVLGSCTTSVSGTASRKHNVGRAAQSCNGIILNPGEVFSYNSTLGQRTAENGYRAAAAYLNGLTVQEFGGGICQVSSTLYYATLRSNLEIVERYNHTFWPGYITLGMDATVSWGGPDFKFKNNTPYPIKLEVVYANGRATCTIYGTNITGNSVKMEYKELSVTPYSVIEKVDPSLNPGERKQQQNGYTGRKVVSYRCVYDSNGKLLSRTLEATSLYRSRDQIMLVGPTEEVLPPQQPSGNEQAPDVVDPPVTPPASSEAPSTSTDVPAVQPPVETPAESPSPTPSDATQNAA